MNRPGQGPVDGLAVDGQPVPDLMQFLDDEVGKRAVRFGRDIEKEDAVLAHHVHQHVDDQVRVLDRHSLPVKPSHRIAQVDIGHQDIVGQLVNQPIFDVAHATPGGTSCSL